MQQGWRELMSVKAKDVQVQNWDVDGPAGWTLE